MSPAFVTNHARRPSRLVPEPIARAGDSANSQSPSVDSFMRCDCCGMTQTRWQRLTEWPLVLLALIFLITYGWEVIADLPDGETQLPEVVLTFVWVAFVVDYVVNLALAPNRRQWFVGHIWELAIVALPMLRPLRLLRLLSIVAMLHRTGLTAFRGRVAIYIVATTALLVLVAGIAVLDAEQNTVGANITNVGDAWWWAFATITTVGYGDFFPVTLAGRLVAVVLMGCGVALLGSVTALLASWLIEQVNAAKISRSTAIEPEHVE